VAHADAPHRCSILVVDDDRDIQEMLRVTLADEGFSVATAGEGREAIDYLRSHSDTCVIVLDLLLPGMSGAEFRQVLLRDRALAWIPVIVISGSDDVAASSGELRAHGVVPKPIDLDRLRREVARVAGRNCRCGSVPAELAGRRARPLSSA
jgi:CheY-like chemotaxis protein